MRDWNSLVRERLSLTALSPEQRDETIAELACHLDDLCEDYRTHGLSEAEAVTRAIHEVTDWYGLDRTIQRVKGKEGCMNDRIRHFWLPGFVSLTGAVLVFATLIRLGVQPHIYYTRHAAIEFYFPWLAVLPICGAAGAYLSRRAGGELLARLSCGLFPALVLLISIVCIILFANIFGTDGFISPPALAIVLATWILVPGVALLLGTLPFVRPRCKGTGSVVS